MTTTLIISFITVGLMIASVLFKPYIKIKNKQIGLYWIVCLIGAIFLLAFKKISIIEAFNGITANTSVNPVKILILFISMTIISLYLEDAGFFDYIADLVFKKIGKGGIKLFFAIFIVVSILTMFTSNDIVILTFTPPICIFCKKAGVSASPYLFGEFIAANTWSMFFIIGNPTNIYLGASYGITFFEYFKVMWLPTLIGGLFGLGVLFLLFYKSLTKKPSEKIRALTPTTIVAVNKTKMIAATIALLLCIIFLATSNFIGLEMWLICLIFAGTLTVFNLVYDIVKDKKPLKILSTIKKAPYELIPFVLSMFIIVLALDKCGFTKIISDLLIKGKNTDAITFGFVSAISSNLLNNIPMSVLFEKIAVSTPAVYGAIIGSNVGAFITPVGALAGIMWNKILVNQGAKVSFLKFTLCGLAVAIPTLISSTLILSFII